MAQIFGPLVLLFSGLLSPLMAAELLPSETTTLMIRAMQHNPAAERTTITQPIIARMQSDNLSEIEHFLKAEAYFINFEPEPARDAYSAFRERDDDFGRVALQRLSIIRINAFGMVGDVVGHDIPIYRERFGISAFDRYGISYPLAQAARQLAAKGKEKQALDLVVDEVKRHYAFDAPYSAYRLPDQFMDLAEEQGRGQEFRLLRQWVADGVGGALKARLGKVRPAKRRALSLPGSMLGTLFDDQHLDFNDWTAEFLKLDLQLKQMGVQ